ncbi:MAG TPA: pyruvate dehydrogenase (acetyl-transferring) E1 component subunit alpha [Actinomycetota bacterium]|nr:pyruvate dehydrogenase (acetyl-transferring) E1 component subunit alpha [Actinomycetota bacterium]
MNGPDGAPGTVPRAADPDEPYRVLPPDGSGAPAVEPADLGLKDEDLRELYRLLVKVRRADVEATALQRQGELAVYPPLIGQEAAQVGSAFAMRRQDYLFPSYREMGVAVARGVDLVEYLHFYRATWHGGTYDANEHRFGYVSVPVGSQALHAVGWAMGAKKDGRTDVAVAYFGDGATSEGDVHEAWNFAAVFGSPVVFFCQNNQWAISVPLSQQTVAPIWRKAGAYGFPGVRVDGNDVLAVYQVVREAAERARTTGTPTLVEALTYRLGPHSTADDAGRYQPKEQVEEWRAKDPVVRYERFLRERGLADDEFVAAAEAEAKEFGREVRDGVIASEPRPLPELFEWVYGGDLPPVLARQRDELLGDADGEG